MTTTYTLPRNTVFEGKHAGDRNFEIARDNLILLTEAGSRVTGVNLGGDDKDLIGICIEPPEIMLGTGTFEEYHYRSQPEGERSQEGDTDLNVYGLSKWVHEVTKGNLNYLIPLFAPPSKIVFSTEAGMELRKNASLFLARSHVNNYLGYLGAQRKHITSERSPRTELVAQYGFDTKYAYHAARVARQGAQLMRIGKLLLPLEYADRTKLLDIRRGYYTQSDVLKLLGKMEAELVDAAKYSKVLPETVDFALVDGYLKQVYLSWWRQQGEL